MKKLLSLLLLVAFTGFLNPVHAQGVPENTNAIIFQEDFNNWTDDSLSANGWSTITLNYNYISPADDAMQFFKQVDANWMLLITPGIDLTNATMIIFDQKKYSSINGMKIKVGVMTDPADTNTFQMLDIFNVTTMDWETDTVFLSGFTGTNYIAFNGMGPIPYTLFYIDNVIVTGDEVSADWPSFVTDLTAVAGPSGAQYATLSWTNPSTQADGDPLTDLDSVVVLANDAWSYTLENPVIGQPVGVQAPVPAAGFYVFSVTAYNTAGASTTIKTDTLWVGLDTPGPAQNIVMTVVNDSTSR